MKNKSVKEKVEATLNSIDSIKPAAPPPYFYMKVLSKINNARVSIWETWSTFFLRPTVAFAAVCFIVVVNAFVLYSKLDNSVPSKDQELALSEEYNQAVTSLYDLENEKP